MRRCRGCMGPVPASRQEIVLNPAQQFRRRDLVTIGSLHDDVRAEICQYPVDVEAAPDVCRGDGGLFR